MDFYYHPILGLQLTFSTCFFVLDIDSIPESMTADECIKILQKTGVEFLQSIVQKGTMVINKITSNTENL